ncbi:YacL family protein [Paraglaciecola sp. L1A13]|uniref:UPF0231 family protein n=1 Tax=Paraglaciecola sp. L1A13 TaxID=2686359 RepID=UPI00131B8E04|nr:YacL family protein [Paraglaciecola sp. L1A13]|tara:strand:- start:10231 stop:10599 length:369 start_codon:yes stop_codon:yes gene_type:complete
MDYQFIRNDRAEPMAIFDMGAETLGLWFSEELGRDHHKIAHLLNVIKQLENKDIEHYELCGREFNMELNRDEVEVYATITREEGEIDIPQDTELYDQESISGCGLEDFKSVLLSWSNFIGSA